MLAASQGPSNVPPDNLQAAPIIAFTAVATDELRAVLARIRTTTNPGVPAQHNSAGPKPRGTPATIVAEQPEPAVGHDPETTAQDESTPEQDELPRAKR